MNVSVLSTSMFACPREAHYYFGDYYDDTYLRVGIYPWFDCVRLGTWNDPIFIYARWDHHRTDPRWEERTRHEFVQRHDDRSLRPPRTYREQETRLRTMPESQRHSQQLAHPVSTLVAAPAAPIRLQRADAATHQNDVQQSQAAHNVRDERSHRESTPPATPPPATTPSHTSERNTTRYTAPTAPAHDTPAPAPVLPTRQQPSSATGSEPSSTPRTSDHTFHSNQTPAPSTTRTATPTTTTDHTQPTTDADPRSRSHEFPTRSTPTAPSRDTTPAPVHPEHTQTTPTTITEPSTTPRTSDRTFHSNMSPAPSVTRTTPTATAPDPTPRPSAPAVDSSTFTRGNDRTYRGVSVAPTYETQPTAPTPDRSRATSVVVPADPNATPRATDRTTRSYPPTVTVPPRTTTPVAVPPTTPGQNTTSGDAGSTTRGTADPASTGDFRRDRSRDDR